MTIAHAFFNLCRVVVMEHTPIGLPIAERLPRTRHVWYMKPAPISFALSQESPAAIWIIGWIDLVNGDGKK
ncbi:unnamed protein product [Fusarium graminearum]|nr:unnamed protein product [Fusarium graminearum]CAG1966545.1 unnamed protein product [Fusarium graminearum]VTO85729.1 unnamed protein product [Fusarium graminearum]